MRVLLINYRYFLSGGPERYMFNVSQELTKHGHEVIPFSVRYSQNDPTPYDRYFVDPIGDEDQVTFRDHGVSAQNVARGLERLFYSREVEQAVIRIVQDTQPDVAYVLCYKRKLSPSVLVALS